MDKFIKVRGAREHNLKSIDVDIPKDKLVVFTGMSGSGKSSLAFDTIYAEGQRRYVESLSTYARQFLGIMKKPDVDLIEGLSPAISIDQKTVSHNPRSTVGTVTEIYDYLRLLFARVGHPHCPICGREIESQGVEQIVDKVLTEIKGNINGDKNLKYMILSPLVQDKKGEYSGLLDNLKGKGIKRARIDKIVKDLNEDFLLIKTNKHTIEAVLDRLSFNVSDLRDEIKLKTLASRLADSIEQALKLSNGLVIVSKIKDVSFDFPEYPKEFEDHLYSERFACPIDNIQLPEIEPRTFSFNSPHGACPECTGLGSILKIDNSMILAPEISIVEGGIIPYASIFEHDTWLSRLISKVCADEGINTHIPIKLLSTEQIDLLMNGTGAKEYKVEGTNRFGKATVIHEKFTGVVNELEQRYVNTDSDYIKGGIERYMKKVRCEKCKGKRLKDEALSITIDKKSIADITGLPITQAIHWVKILKEGKILTNIESQIGQMIIKEILSRLQFLEDVGLDYLSLDREAGTLAGGEAQRIRLASQIGSGLTGVLYILDEPTIGLHPRDNERLIETLKSLRELGNTVIVVEHDKDVMRSSDYIFDFGPKAGKHGGSIVASGTLDEIKNNKSSVTGPYLGGTRKIQIKTNLWNDTKGKIKLIGAEQFNLKNIDVEFPLGKLIAVTGVSGSGKSTLIVDTLYHALAKKTNRQYHGTGGKHRDVEGTDETDKVVLIDQSPIGRTPRSNPATYCKVFDQMRDVFALTRDAKTSGFKKGRFSFNVKGGRCEACEGQGQNKIEMQFMPDIWVTCEVCKGARYNTQTLEVTYKGKSIADVLTMTVEEAIEFFHVYEPIVHKLQTLKAVGLDYIELGQPATTLSGGEAQRVKLATELARRDSGRTVYILDEPTTGLHFKDLEKLLVVLKLLVDKGNTVIVIEHNLDVIMNADWVIDLGPEGGEFGGSVVAEGKPADIAKNADSHTGKFISHELNR